MAGDVISSIHSTIVRVTGYGSFGEAKTGQMPRHIKD